MSRKVAKKIYRIVKSGFNLLPEKKEGRITDTASQTYFRSPYENSNSFATKAVKKVQKLIRRKKKSQ